MQILIVDDSRAMRSIVVRAVKAAGYEQAAFAEAQNGAEALAAVRQSRPDLILSDWNMPEMSGIELLRALRAEGIQVPFGFVTSESDAAWREQAFSSGALFVISKPFTPQTVKEALGGVRI
jgi:two-component system chemotaxis response regulator CheY